MPEEVILRNDMRPVGIALCSFGLMGAMGFLLLSYFGSFAAQSEGEILLARVLATAGIVAFVWKMTVLNDQKNFLETSDDGIKIYNSITKYIPWENVKNIAIKRREIDPGADKQRTQYLNGIPTPVIYLELYSADKILFESKVRKLSARKIDKFLKQIAADNNRLALDILITAHTQEEICAMLQARWKLTLNNSCLL